MKLYYSDPKWNNDLQILLKEISFQPELIAKDYTPDVKPRVFSFEKLKEVFRRKASPVGGVGIEGMVPFLVDGIDLILDNPVLELLGLWSLYDWAEQKYHNIRDGETKKPSDIFQIITDYEIGEAGDTNPNRKSITFVFPTGLSKKDFEVAENLRLKVREKIIDLLSIATISNVNHLECRFKYGKWDISFVKNP